MMTAPFPLILVPLILEAALRALLAAVAVEASLRLLRVGNVLVQKAAWGLVLVAALAMPLMPNWTGLAALRLPAIPLLAGAANQLPAASGANPTLSAPAVAAFTGKPAGKLTQSPLHQTLLRPTPLTRTARGQELTAPQSVIPESVSASADRYPAPAISNWAFDQPAQSASPQSPSSQTDLAKPAASPINLVALGWLLYLGVFVALFMRLLLGLASAVRMWMAAGPIDGLANSDFAAGLRLRSSPRVASPVNIGSGIVLPADYVCWDQEKLRVVLAHERSHIRQGDFYLQLLAGFYACLFWFSPLGWWLKRKLSELSEAISDRAGLEEAASRSSYAQLLLEFAALPRPTLTGVAMARTSHLTQRIERLLNESSFRQAFAAGGRRALLAVVLVPVALFAATALVHVEAAAAPVVLAVPQNQVAGQSTPAQVTDQNSAPMPAPAASAASPAEAPAPAAEPPTPPEPASGSAPQMLMLQTAPQAPAPAAAADPSAPPVVLNMAPFPPNPPIVLRIPRDEMSLQMGPEFRAEIAAAKAEARNFGIGFAYLQDGDQYALVGDPGTHTRFNGVWDGNHEEEIEKARKMAHGHFLWFRHDGKSYIVDDPAIVAQIEAMNKPMDDLGAQMRGLGEQMREVGKQQTEAGKQMHDVAVPTPDLTKEMADLNAAIESLKAKQGGTISQKELGELEGKLGRIQGELGTLQGKLVMQQMNLNGGMSKFGEEQGKLGAQMGELGSKMGQLGRENREKVNSIIDESLKNGKAKPVE